MPDAFETADSATQKASVPTDNVPIISVPSITESEQIKAIDSKVVNKFIYLIPFGVALIGLVAYFIVIPNIYGKIVSFVDWLFADPQNIINTLKDPDAVLPQIHSIIGIRVFWWIWLTSFIASLFFVGRQLQRKPEPNASNAIIYKKDAYFIIQEVLSELKLVNQRKSSKELDSLVFNIKKLEEKIEY